MLQTITISSRQNSVILGYQPEESDVNVEECYEVLTVKGNWSYEEALEYAREVCDIEVIG